MLIELLWCVCYFCRFLRPIVTQGLRPKGVVLSVGVFLRDPSPTKQLLEKTTENSEQLGRRARPRIELGTSRLPIFSTESLSHRWGLGLTV